MLYFVARRDSNARQREHFRARLLAACAATLHRSAVGDQHAALVTLATALVDAACNQPYAQRNTRGEHGRQQHGIHKINTLQ